MMDEDYGDITDIKSGTDLKLTCSKAPGQQWATTEILPRRKSSKLSNDKNQVKEWVDNIPDINSIFQLKSYDELSGIINNWLNGDESEDDGSEWSSSKKSESTDTDDGKTSYSSLDDAFSDLMN